jgi:small subunit ribosomal protein S16
MALKIRLRQQGRKNSIVYRLVLTDSRSPRDGKYLEMLGWYNPQGKGEENCCSLSEERVRHWLSMGAEVTHKAKLLINREAPEVIREYQNKRVAAMAKACQKKRILRRRKHEGGKKKREGAKAKK